MFLLKKSILFLIFFITSIIIYFSLEIVKDNRVTEYENIVFDSEYQKILDKFDSIYTKEYFESINISKSLIKTLNIKEFLYERSKEFNYFDSNDRYIKLFDDTGNELYNNMPDDYTKKRGHKETYIKNFIRSPKEELTLFNDHTGVTVNNLIPIYDKNFMGVVETRIQLDEIVSKLNMHNIKTVFLLNVIDSKKININLSHSRQFLNNYYIVNKNADKYYTKIIEQSNIINSVTKKLVNKKDGYIIVKKKIYTNDQRPLLDVYLIKTTDNINFEDINTIKNLLNIIMVVTIIFIGLLLYYVAGMIQNKHYAQQNEKLLNDNAQLKSLSDKLDFNEKKLSNLFNLQPNIMFISNGVNIVQVNKRFMGFFRRYETFDNFKNRHKNIAELFEPSDQPFYISDQLIEGKDWLEYIIENPKRLYKTIMSVDDEQHHFIIKVNEMEYVKNYNERYIVVAFVDVTQDIKAKEILKEKHKIEQEELDITYIIEDNISYSIHEITNLVPTKQTIFKADIKEYHGVNLISLQLDLNINQTPHKWKFIIPASSISFISNVKEYNYDGEVCDIINKDLNDSAYETVNLIVKNLITELEMINNEQLTNITYDLVINSKFEATQITDKNLYKFIMFIDNYEIDIMIDFDDDTLPYIKQIQMLGMLFG